VSQNLREWWVGVKNWVSEWQCNRIAMARRLSPRAKRIMRSAGAAQRENSKNSHFLAPRCVAKPIVWAGQTYYVFYVDIWFYLPSIREILVEVRDGITTDRQTLWYFKIPSSYGHDLLTIWSPPHCLTQPKVGEQSAFPSLTTASFAATGDFPFVDGKTHCALNHGTH